MTLQLYILRQLVLGLVYAVAGMIVVAVPGMAIAAIQKVGGAYIGLVLGYLPMEFVDLIPYFIPIGFLLAVVSTYSRMAADNEWTAMVMAGFSPLRLFLPGLVVALLLGGATWYMATEVAPPMGLLKKQYRNSAVVKGIKNLPPGRTQFRVGDFMISSRFREDNDFREAQINIPGRDGAEDQQLLAERLTVEMTETELLVHAQGARWIHTTRDASVENLTLRRRLDQLFGAEKAEELKYKYLTSRELRAALVDGLIKPVDVLAARHRLHDRDSMLAICMVFFLVGAPIGLMLSGGTQLGALASSVGFALVYYTITLRFGRDLASQGTIPPWLGGWGGALLGLSVGAVLTARVFRR
ncbi:MAG TPA: LptF/LptG family permease [Planctomycetota bacterium]|nr:LptF/LptG family permease [Planctomycetota bacterium]